MPRSSVLITARVVDAQAVAEAAGAVRARLGWGHELTLLPVDDGAALQILAGTELVLTVTRPRVMPRIDEIVRLRPDVDTTGIAVPAFWTDAFTPWGPAGDIGRAIIDEIAAAQDGIADHDPAPPAG
ncbi:hypothetical protein LG315_06750 [Microbacterium marinum]|uniref:hypothetical protein n=1 Tax=Microbacterium marinum TaxID=421115 RepID=UPI0038507C77